VRDGRSHEVEIVIDSELFCSSNTRGEEKARKVGSNEDGGGGWAT
jgi:hypothetical protein